jgi:hypothetical protein
MCAIFTVGKFEKFPDVALYRTVPSRRAKRKLFLSCPHTVVGSEFTLTAVGIFQVGEYKLFVG